MTVAVCLKSGAWKHRAWTPCAGCGFLPNDDESLTRHLLATDHYLNREALEAVAAKVKAGQPVEVPPDVLKAAWVNKQEMERGQKRMTVGCLSVVAVVVALVWYLMLG